MLEEGDQHGPVHYVAEKTGRKAGPVTREMRSEAWMNPAEAGRLLAEDHLLNTTVGVWMYESDLCDKKALKQRLMALVRHVTSPEFMSEYEQWGREQARAMKASKVQAKRVPRGKKSPRT